MTTGLRYGDQIIVIHPELNEPAQAKFVGQTGGTTAMVELAGTYQLVQVPKLWIDRKVELGHKGRTWSGR